MAGLDCPGGLGRWQYRRENTVQRRTSRQTAESLRGRTSHQSADGLQVSRPLPRLRIHTENQTEVLVECLAYRHALQRHCEVRSRHDGRGPWRLETFCALSIFRVWRAPVTV